MSKTLNKADIEMNEFNTTITQSREYINNVCVENMSDCGIRKTDELNGLECFCSDSPPNNNIEGMVRGHVFYGDKLVFKSSPYPEEVIIKSGEKSGECDEYENKNNYKTLNDIDFSNAVCTPLCEGTVIRMFYYGEQWYITTHRKLNAFRSKWGDDSFGDIFEGSVLNVLGMDLESFKNILDKEKGYSFLIGTTETTRVVTDPFVVLYLIGMTDKNGKDINLYASEKSTLNEMNINQKLIDIIIPRIFFNNQYDLIDFVQELKYPYEYIIGVYIKTSDNVNLKVINEEYNDLSKLRHNLPSIMFAYLHNVFDEKKNALFRKIYASHKSQFDFYDSEIKEIAVDLYKKYLFKYVPTYKGFKNNFEELSEQEFNVLKLIHNLYKNTRVNIKLEDVSELLKTVNVSTINRIISQRRRARKMLLNNTNNKE
ncbi:Immediate early protein ICP-46 [Dasineura jujubifolia toursvirus 2a]|nr:Immediate early protein ICP-46 [Dasineura jujubifolia toursvirus 2a]